MRGQWGCEFVVVGREFVAESWVQSSCDGVIVVELATEDMNSFAMAKISFELF